MKNLRNFKTNSWIFNKSMIIACNLHFSNSFDLMIYFLIALTNFTTLLVTAYDIILSSHCSWVWVGNVHINIYINPIKAGLLET